MMRRVYTDTAHFRAPYDTPNISFSGLGSERRPEAWPTGRTYWSTHFYRAPYQAGYYQSGALRGFGDDAVPTPPTPSQITNPTGPTLSITLPTWWGLAALGFAAYGFGAIAGKVVK